MANIRCHTIDDIKSSEYSFHAIIDDEYTDASNLEKLTECVR